MDASKPTTVQTTEIQAEQIVTDLKFLKTLIADNAGNTTKAEISNEPTSFIARTITTAITTAIIKL